MARVRHASGGKQTSIITNSNNNNRNIQNKSKNYNTREAPLLNRSENQRENGNEKQSQEVDFQNPDVKNSNLERGVQYTGRNTNKSLAIFTISGAPNISENEIDENHRSKLDNDLLHDINENALDVGSGPDLSRLHYPVYPLMDPFLDGKSYPTPSVEQNHFHSAIQGKQQSSTNHKNSSKNNNNYNTQSHSNIMRKQVGIGRSKERLFRYLHETMPTSPSTGHAFPRSKLITPSSWHYALDEGPHDGIMPDA